jgi:hypothetical protein
MTERIRTEKQKLNDAVCSARLKAYHAELKRLKEEKLLQEVNEEFQKATPIPLKIKNKTKSVKELIETFEPESITPLSNNPDEFDIPRRKYNKKSVKKSDEKRNDKHIEVYQLLTSV